MVVTCILFVVLLFLNRSENGTCKLICELGIHDDSYKYGWDDSSNRCSFYYKKFEQALLNNLTILWQLQQMFVLHDPVSVNLDVNVTVKTICNGAWSSDSYCTWDWNPHKSLSDIINIDYLSALDITAISKILVLLVTTRYSPPDLEFKLMLYLDELPCSSNQTDVVAALPPFLSWIKAYAKWHGKPDSWDSNDKGLINYYPAGESSTMHELNQYLMVGYICELVLAFMLVLKFAPGYYQVLAEKMHHNLTMYSIYWGSVFIITLSNASFIPINILFGGSSANILFIIFYKSSFKELSLMDRLTFVVVISVVLLSLAVAMWIACKTSRQNSIRMPIPTVVVNTCCFCCICDNRNIKSIAIQIIVLWNVLFFVHAVVTSTIPLCFHIILHPSNTLSMLSLIFSTFFFFIILAAHLFHLGQSSVWKLCSNIFVTLLFSGIVAIFILVYIVCLYYGVQTKGIGGFLFSLLPSAFLSVFGWFIKRKFLKTAENSNAETGLPTAEHEDSDIQINSNVNDSQQDVDGLEQVVVHPLAQTLASSPTERTPLLQQEN